MTAPDSPLMTAAEFNALAGRTIKIADGLNENPVQLMCAAYRRAISEVERLLEEVADSMRESVSDASAITRLRSEVERVTKERDGAWEFLREAVEYAGEIPKHDCGFYKGEGTSCRWCEFVAEFVGNGDAPTGAVRGDAAIPAGKVIHDWRAPAHNITPEQQKEADRWRDEAAQLQRGTTTADIRKKFITDAAIREDAQPEKTNEELLAIARDTRLALGRPPREEAPRTCNRHKDCDAADRKARETGRTYADHCHDSCCEDCFGN